MEQERAPRVSVILPTYNGEKYLGLAVRSVLRQTFGDFELLVLDDGSTDTTPRILERLAASDERMRVISLPHGGIVAALREGVRQAQANLIARMDGDDICLPERFARQVEYLDAHPEVVVLGTNWVGIDPAGRPFWRSRKFVTESAAIRASLERGTNPMLHPSVMFRPAAYERAGGYRFREDSFEDHDLWKRLIAEGEFANLPEVLTLYRRHQRAVSVGRGRQRPGADITAARYAGWARIARRDGYRAAAWRNALQAVRLEPASLSNIWLLGRTVFARNRRG